MKSIMPFNHYAKIKKILETADAGWTVKRIDKPTSAKNFKGEMRQFDHYYRVYDKYGVPIPYCKFQQIDLFAEIMKIDVDNIMLSEI